MPRWSFSTWLLVLLAAVVLFFVEIPGRRIGAMKYAHGWPFVYLQRDYGGFSASGPSAQTGPLEDLWTQGRMPAFCEEAMIPWSWSGDKRSWQLAADLTFAISLLIAMGTLREAWRRRHPSRARRRFFQYSLRTLLMAVPLAALASAYVASSHEEHLAEETLRSTNVWVYPSDDFQQFWLPPSWLPESVTKLAPTAWFVHITRIRVSPLRELQRDAVKKLHHLEALECEAPDAADLAAIAEIPSLTELQISGLGITAATIKDIARLPRLRRLSIEDKQIDAAALAELSGFASLEELDIGQTAATQIDLHGLKNLRSVVVGGRARGFDRLRYFSIDFEGPGKPQLPDSADGVIRPLVRLADLPALVSVMLRDATLDETSCADLAKLESIEDLDLTDCLIADGLEIGGRNRLRDVSIWNCSCRSVHLHDLPQLHSLDMEDDGRLRVLTLERLPQLEHCRAENCLSLDDVSLVELPQLGEPQRGFISKPRVGRP